MQNIKARNSLTRVISEQEIRSALLDRLKIYSGHDARIQEELRIERGNSRIDVAVIDKALVGYEIKSDSDTFIRFPNQIHAYNRVFDRIHLVCGSLHLEKAKLTIPSWWGLSVALRDHENNVYLELVRNAEINPKQDSFSLASLLWKDEALAMLKVYSSELPKRSSSHLLWEHIATSLPLETIRLAVVNSLLNRVLQ